jgi:hypothetical protein
MLEMIEPQCRQAVLVLNEKGYNTYASGFYGYSEQRMAYNPHDMPMSLILSALEPLRQSLAQEGMVLTVSSNSIDFNVGRQQLTLSELTTVWNAIADAMPARQGQAEEREFFAGNYRG